MEDTLELIQKRLWAKKNYSNNAKYLCDPQNILIEVVNSLKCKLAGDQLEAMVHLTELMNELNILLNEKNITNSDIYIYHNTLVLAKGFLEHHKFSDRLLSNKQKLNNCQLSYDELSNNFNNTMNFGDAKRI